jgi:hypothetical protein
MVQLVREYLIPEDKSTEYFILLFTIFLIILVWSLILAFSAKNTSTFIGYEVCTAGDCPTNRFTGEKRCSNNPNLPLQYDPIFEVCNPPKGCTANSTPYAVLSDGYSAFDGQCDISGCRCVNYLTTPSYVEVLFNVQGGSIYSTQPEKQTNLQFSQQASPYVGEGNNVPIIYQDPTTQLWQIAPSQLSYLSPNTCAAMFAVNSELTGGDTLKCINMNPCIAGRLAYVPKNTSAYANFGIGGIQGGVPLACVPNRVDKLSSPSNENDCINQSGTGNYYAPVFNTVSGLITCIDSGIPVVV